MAKPIYKRFYNLIRDKKNGLTYYECDMRTVIYQDGNYCLIQKPDGLEYLYCYKNFVIMKDPKIRMDIVLDLVNGEEKISKVANHFFEFQVAKQNAALVDNILKEINNDLTPENMDYKDKHYDLMPMCRNCAHWRYNPADVIRSDDIIPMIMGSLCSLGNFKVHLLGTCIMHKPVK